VCVCVCLRACLCVLVCLCMSACLMCVCVCLRACLCVLVCLCMFCMFLRVTIAEGVAWSSWLSWKPWRASVTRLAGEAVNTIVTWCSCNQSEGIVGIINTIHYFHDTVCVCVCVCVCATLPDIQFVTSTQSCIHLLKETFFPLLAYLRSTVAWLPGEPWTACESLCG
uniref:Uncharacterized protein n=1 Tax=Oncorhynchus kisutch TaxID=8019 RepID=A0A8C7IL19_ONCKI